MAQIRDDPGDHGPEYRVFPASQASVRPSRLFRPTSLSTLGALVYWPVFAGAGNVVLRASWIAFSPR